MINGLRGNSYEEKLRELVLQSLKERRTEADLILAYKLVHGLISVNSDSWPKLQNELGRDLPHRTRSAADELKLRQPFAHSDKRKTFSLCEYVKRGINYRLTLEDRKISGSSKNLCAFLQHPARRRPWTTRWPPRRSCPRRSLQAVLIMGPPRTSTQVRYPSK
jgi:hypothetical protein